MALPAAAQEAGPMQIQERFRWFPPTAIFGLLAILYWSTARELVSDWWSDEGYSYGFLIPPICLYLAWRQKDAIRKHAAAGDFRGLLVLLAGCVVFLLGRLSVELFLCRLSFVIVLAGLVWLFLGLRVLRTLSFAFLLLVTMIPLPTVVYFQVTTPLRLLASSVSAAVAQACGIAIYRDGNILQLSTMSLGVAEACSGLRSAMSLAVSALLVGHLEGGGAVSRVALFILAVPVSIALNILRVTGTAFLAEWDPDMATGFYHMFSGWLVYVVGFGTLYLLALGLKLLQARTQ